MQRYITEKITVSKTNINAKDFNAFDISTSKDACKQLIYHRFFSLLLYVIHAVRVRLCVLFDVERQVESRNVKDVPCRLSDIADNHISLIFHRLNRAEQDAQSEGNN